MTHSATHSASMMGNQNRTGIFESGEYWPGKAWVVLDRKTWYTSSQVMDVLRQKYPRKRRMPKSILSLAKALSASKRFEHKIGRGPEKRSTKKGYGMVTTSLYRTREYWPINPNRKGIDWAKRVWAVAKFGKEYTASQLFDKMFCGPWSLPDGTPLSSSALSKILQESGYFDVDYKNIMIPKRKYRGARNMFVKRRLY